MPGTLPAALLFLGVAPVGGSPALAQEADSAVALAQRPRPLGGPLDGIAQIEADNRPKPMAYRFSISPLEDWQAWKDEFYEDSAIRFNLNYTALYVSGTSAIEEGAPRWAASGILDLAASWTPVGRRSGDTGTLLLKVNNRHAIGSDRTPMFLGFDTGYYGLPGTGFREYTTRILELNWTQIVDESRAWFAVGKVDPLNYFNYHRLIVPWRHYIGLGSLVSGTVNWPDPGWGFVGGVRLTKSFYVGGALSDARGDVYRDGQVLYGGNQFFSGTFFSALELGYTPTQEERFDRRVGLLAWHTPRYTEDGSDIVSEEAYGLAFSAHWTFAERLVPFVRLAASNGQGITTLYERDVQLGVGWWARNYDMLAVSGSWARPNLDEVKNQLTAELFYRVVVTESIEITPDVQVIVNPALSPSKSAMGYLGVRTRLSF
jgi:porin